MPTQAIQMSLQRRGYRDISIRQTRGSTYVASARNGRGDPVLVVVDGRSGEIIGLRQTGFDSRKRYRDDIEERGSGWRLRRW